MFVCICQNVTDHEIRRAVRERGLTRLREVRDHLGVASQCGRCARCAKDVLADELARQELARQEHRAQRAGEPGGGLARPCIRLAVAA